MAFWNMISMIFVVLYDILHYCMEKKKTNEKKMKWRCRGSNPGPFTCKANAVPLSYIAILEGRAYTFIYCRTLLPCYDKGGMK